jgi:hypothetical protein
MDRKVFVIFIIVILAAGACVSTPSAPAVVPTLQPTATSSVPTLPPTFTATVTAQPVNLITSTPIPTQTVVVITPLAPEIPVAPGARQLTRNYADFLTGQTGNTLYLSDSTDVDEIEIFYMDELVNLGWKWVYTETGESLVTTIPAPALIMEFKKEEHKLGIAAIRFDDGLIVLAGMDISGTQLASGYIGGIAGGFDLISPSESAIRPGAMHFSSTLLEFSHPSDWLATDQLISIFETDKAVNYYPNKNRCSVNMDICFVTFSVLRGFHFDHPISIRAHPDLANMTLEEASKLRWDDLKANASAQERRYRYPEDLARADSLESIEVRAITLGDGTPAIQRIYRWKQDDVDEFIIGTYTLFISRGTLMEFHTDFTSDGWNEVRGIVNQVVAGMKINP